MPGSWRNYRPLVVNGLRFRWTCDFHVPAEIHSVGFENHGDAWPPDRLLVRPENEPHRLLTVAWPACRGPAVTPGLVRKYIAAAAQRGWPVTNGTLVLAGDEDESAARGL